MKYVFIINSFGLRDPQTIYSQIKKVCNSINIDYVIEINSNKLSTEDIVAKYKNSQNVIFAVGGDGMINTVLNELVNTDNYFSYIPYGTGNDFDKSVDETLKSGFNDIDLVKINDRYFINVACFGIDADIANSDSIVHNKFIPKSQRYNVSALYNIVKNNSRFLDVTWYDDFENGKKERYALFSTVVVCNARYYGNGYKISPKSILNDGLLDIHFLENINKLKLLQLMLSAKNGNHLKSSYVYSRKTNKLSIESVDLLSANIDGEIIKGNRFDIEVKKKALKLYNDPKLIKKIINK